MTAKKKYGEWIGSVMFKNKSQAELFRNGLKRQGLDSKVVSLKHNPDYSWHVHFREIL